jgi:2-polyprenyl-3-methyl-5-hydroxy-6-metoxy-1,4-benzoquinol methylase
MSDIEFLSPATSVSMADEWFEFATADHFWMRWRHRIFLQQLKRLHRPMKNALEIGCGHGVVREMVERDLAIPVDGCDLNQRALEMATKGEGRLLVYDIFDENERMLNAYDMILLMDVIEHLDDDASFLCASLKHLKPTGIVVINVPAHMSFYSKYDEVAGHKRRYNSAGLQTLFRAAKVEPIAMVEWGFSLVPLLLARKVVLSFVSREQTIRTGFAPPNALARSVLGALQSIETHMPFPMPFGSSLFAIGQMQNRSPLDKEAV